MYSANLENGLIIVDILDTMRTLTSIQYDMDDQVLKAAQKIVIDLELKKYISKENILRCVDQDEYNVSDADLALKELITPPLCHFTYARLLTSFQGSISDSGYMTEEEAKSRNEAKNAATEARFLGSEYMKLVVEFLEEENPTTEEVENPTNTLIFGGSEGRWNTGENYPYFQ